MAHKQVECWYLWIAVDVIGIGLYFAKGVVFVSLLYLVFLVLATRGLLTWRRDLP
jgi:nicotinamide mononucleotide transporter